MVRDFSPDRLSDAQRLGHQATAKAGRSRQRGDHQLVQALAAEPVGGIEDNDRDVVRRGRRALCLQRQSSGTGKARHHCVTHSPAKPPTPAAFSENSETAGASDDDFESLRAVLGLLAGTMPLTTGESTRKARRPTIPLSVGALCASSGRSRLDHNGHLASHRRRGDQ